VRMVLSVAPTSGRPAPDDDQPPSSSSSSSSTIPPAGLSIEAQAVEKDEREAQLKHVKFRLSDGTEISADEVTTALGTREFVLRGNVRMKVTD
jgi:hypothetical protein